MPELTVQRISKSLYICIPNDLLRGDLDTGMPPLDINKGDVLVATRTKEGIHYKPLKHEGSAWVRMPIQSY